MSRRTSDPPPVTSAIGVENPCPRRKSNRYILSVTVLSILTKVAYILLRSLVFMTRE